MLEIPCWITLHWSLLLWSKPAEADSDQIETLVENNQRYTTREIANILKISKSIKLLEKKSLLFYRKKYTDFLANAIIIFKLE